MWSLDSAVETANSNKQTNKQTSKQIIQLPKGDHFFHYLWVGQYGVLKTDLIAHFALTKRQSYELAKAVNLPSSTLT